jgi:hypothetical protein
VTEFVCLRLSRTGGKGRARWVQRQVPCVLHGRSGSGQSAGGEGRFASSKSVVGRGWEPKLRPSALGGDYREVRALEPYDARRGTVVRVDFERA